MNTFKFLISLFAIFLVIGCSDSKEETKITKQIDGNALTTIEGISIGKYFITKSFPDESRYISCVYIPNPNDEYSIACEATLTRLTTDPLLRIKEGNNNIVYIPSTSNNYANAEFNLLDGKALNKEAEGITIIVYDVHYDKVNNKYRLVAKVQ